MTETEEVKGWWDRDGDEPGPFCPHVDVIEQQPLDYEEDRCPLFGHRCPGGVVQAKACSLDDVEA